MALNIDPPVCQLPAAGGKFYLRFLTINFFIFLGEAIHQLINVSEARLSFKIKSTDNEHYRVQPVYGFIEVSAATPVTITRLEGPPKEDKFVVQWAEVPPEEADPMAPFKAGAVGGEVIFLAKNE